MSGPPFRSHDPTGEPLVLTDLPGWIAVGQAALPLAMRTLHEPAEIWSEWSADDPLPGHATGFAMREAAVVRRYVATWVVDGGELAMTVITTTGRDGWEVRDILIGTAAQAAARRGHLVYRRA